MVTWIIYTVSIIVMHYGVVRNSVWCSDCFGVILYLFISCCSMEIKGRESARISRSRDHRSHSDWPSTKTAP